jgi:hypothetical protein
MRYIGIIILLVLCLTLLLLTGCKVNADIPETAIENIENQENIEEPVKWPGLGMDLEGIDNLSKFDDDVDTLLANGFTNIRVHIPAYVGGDAPALCKAAVLYAVSQGADVIWGVGGTNPLTAANWNDYRLGILDAAQWSQDNGVFEFQLGNEEERKIDGTTLTKSQLIANLKSVATEVKAIFTSGNVSYSCWAGDNSVDDWIAAGKGDIDLLASNIYMGGTTFGEEWKGMIDNLVSAFGVDGTYLTEFAPSWSALNDYSEDEAVQAAAVTEMIEYIKASGMTRASYFCYANTFWLLDFGVVKDDGTYRLLWNQALLNSGSVESTIIPTKTTAISLPDTITIITK